MSEYTPSTNEIREAYIWQDYEDGYHGPCPRDGEEFDRWLAEYTREVAQKAVNVFEDLYFGPGLGQTREWVARCARERLGLPPRLTND